MSAHAVPPHTQRPALTVAGDGENTRPTVLRLAHACLNDQITDVWAATVLRRIAPHLSEERRWEAFEELIEAVALKDSVLLGFTHWCEVVPDATGVDRDGQAADQAQVRVDLALDELAGGG
jgi:hypothetical protein